MNVKASPIGKRQVCACSATGLTKITLPHPSVAYVVAAPSRRFASFEKCGRRHSFEEAGCRPLCLKRGAVVLHAAADARQAGNLTGYRI